MALSQPVPRRLTRAEYDRMIALGFFHGERLELIRGSLISTPPIGPPHAKTVSRLNRLLLPRLMGRADVRIQQPLIAHDESEPEPDVSVVPLGDYGASHPDKAFLVIEVAESSLATDRDLKVPLYALSNVAEYWIVDLSAAAVEVYRQPRGNGYGVVQRVERGGNLTVVAFADVTLAVSEILA